MWKHISIHALFFYHFVVSEGNKSKRTFISKVILYVLEQRKKWERISFSVQNNCLSCNAFYFTSKFHCSNINYYVKG